MPKEGVPGGGARGSDCRREPEPESLERPEGALELGREMDGEDAETEDLSEAGRQRRRRWRCNW